MSEAKEKQKIEKIRERILQSGFPLEIEIGNILRKNGWLVTNQWPYTDKITEKIRTLDIVAIKMRPQPPRPLGLGVMLLVECKKSLKQDWVFHTQEKGKEFFPAIMTILDLVQKLVKIVPSAGELLNLTYDKIMATKLSGLHVLDKAIKIGVFNMSAGSGESDFYKATNQISSALGSMGESMGSFIGFPTIVFDGEIFEYYQQNGEPQILPINHLQFMSFREDMEPCLIDIVRKTYFSEFLKIIENDSGILTEFAKGNVSIREEKSFKPETRIKL